MMLPSAAPVPESPRHPANAAHRRHPHRAHGLRALVMLLLVMLAALPSVALRAEAATTPAPRPATVTVMGDSMAGGLYRGLVRHYKADADLKVVNLHKVSTSLTRRDYFDWVARIDEVVAETGTLDIVVFNIGLNDRQGLVQAEGPVIHLEEPEWDGLYAERVATIMAKLQAAGAQVIWVGLPVARQNYLSRHYERMNQIYAAEAAKAGVLYIDAWARTIDAKGNYAATFKNDDGRRQKMRDDDGIHFTAAGYDHINQPVIAAIEALRLGQTGVPAAGAAAAPAAPRPAQSAPAQSAPAVSAPVKPAAEAADSVVSRDDGAAAAPVQ